MSGTISAGLRAQLYRADRGCCAYCLTSEFASGLPLTLDHIQPIAQGGKTEFDNLCLACRPCNEFKADTVTAADPLTGERVVLFHPRTQNWHEHFEWSADATQILGKTATGRATVVTLRMNRQMIAAARRRWFSVGWHPPAEA